MFARTIPPLLALLAALACLKLVAAEPPPVAESPVAYDAAGLLKFPADYRQWPCIGTGLDMAYGPLRAAIGSHPPFTNVFVNPSSYRHFLETGTWPNRTVFILEIRASVALNNSATGNNGRYQGEIVGIEAEVKDAQRFDGGWGFFSVNAQQRTGTMIPKNASCYSCHAANAAVENTFVQFYPVLRDVAKQRGTFKTVAEVF